jgi:hypothetical protein
MEELEMGTQLFDQVIGEAPPSTVDVVGIVRRENRRGAVRRVVSVATAAVSLSVFTAIGLGLTGGTGASSPPSVAGRDATSASAAPDVRFALVAQNQESASASAKRLSAALDAAFRKEAPGAAWIFSPERPGQTGPDGVPPKLSYRVVGEAKGVPEELFHGDSGVLNDGRKGSLHLGVNATDGAGENGTTVGRALKCPRSGPGKCTSGKAPSGARTIFLASTYGDVHVDTCVVGLPDGRSLSITHSNNFAADGSGPPQNGMPLTEAQVKAIAFDVAAHIKAS